MHEALLFPLGGLLIRLESSSSQITDGWEAILHGWPRLVENSHRPGQGRADGSISRVADICLRLKLVERLPEPPPERPLYSERAQFSLNAPTTLAVYREGQGVLLYFPLGAEVYIPMLGVERDTCTEIDGVVTAQLLATGYLNDVLFTALAPVLRRRGYYLVHAFVANYEGRALMLVGSSGSGKTTTGLRLIREGWGFLSDDVASLANGPEGVIATPVPGGMSVSAYTVELLSKVTEVNGIEVTGVGGNKAPVAVSSVTDGWAGRAKVTGICFPRVGVNSESRLAPLSKAQTLARLIECSVDRWDEALLSDHFHLLELVCLQAGGYELDLGRDLERLPELLATTCL